jgi:mRNA (2'-O-methyladenosine-N6-)-methyltransferase
MLSAQQAQVNAQWPKSQLPSGLGAGGRGKEKAPCRYLHYEIDWDAGDAGTEAKWEEIPVKKPHRLALGFGPKGIFEPPVSFWFVAPTMHFQTPLSSASSAMDQL